jgi:AcrR family transcriptional regulator
VDIFHPLTGGRVARNRIFFIRLWYDGAITTTPGRQLRKDAALNRDRLLAAASDLFAQHGTNVTLNDIAHHAGVGVGTAYRRFANKDEVIDALFELRLREVEALAREALQETEAWDGLVTFLEQALHIHGDRGLNQIMNNPALGDDRASQARDHVAPLLAELVERAKAQGSVRPDFDQTDIIFIQLALSAIVDSSRNLAPDLYRRYLTMFLDGIRSPRGEFTSLPVRALSADETHVAMTRPRRGDRS